MHNTIIHLIGFPGVGKYTIAKEIVAQDPDFRLLDAHHVNNVLFALIPNDGIRPLPPRIWQNVGTIWNAVLDTIVHISPPSYSFVMTNNLWETVPGDRAWFEKLVHTFAAQEKRYVPVKIICDVTEHEKRIVQDERRARMKEINPAAPQRYQREGHLLNITHPNHFTLDVTSMPPDQTAQAIFGHIRKL